MFMVAPQQSILKRLAPSPHKETASQRRFTERSDVPLQNLCADGLVGHAEAHGRRCKAQPGPQPHAPAGRRVVPLHEAPSHAPGQGRRRGRQAQFQHGLSSPPPCGMLCAALPAASHPLPPHSIATAASLPVAAPMLQLHPCTLALAHILSLLHIPTWPAA